MGTYNVTLNVTNAYGSNSITKTNYVTVIPGLGGQFHRVTRLLREYRPRILPSRTLRQIFPPNWSWDFGDGGTSTLQNPNHVYTTRGYQRNTDRIQSRRQRHEVTM